MSDCRPFISALAVLWITTFSGCDAAKQQAGQALLQPPAGKKTFHAPQEWTLSDQSKLQAVIESVEKDDVSYGTLVVQRTSQLPPLKSFEFSFLDHMTGQPSGEWMSDSFKSIESASGNSVETFRILLSAPEGTQVVFRVHVGEQPETLSRWKLTLGEN